MPMQSVQMQLPKSRLLLKNALTAHQRIAGRPSDAQSVIAFLRVLLLHQVALMLMMSQQFDSMDAAVIRTLSNVFLFWVSHMFQAIVMKTVDHSTLRSGCIWVRSLSAWHPNGHVDSMTTPLLDNLSFVLRRLWSANQPKILHFFDANEFQIFWLLAHETPPEFKA
jgi:hypothetical protein